MCTRAPSSAFGRGLSLRDTWREMAENLDLARLIYAARERDLTSAEAVHSRAGSGLCSHE
jgi:hypothetical protein